MNANQLPALATIALSTLLLFGCAAAPTAIPLGEWTGQGVFVYANGNRYTGGFKAGKKHGRGIYVWANGNNCDGNWFEGKLSGTGQGMENGQRKKCYILEGGISWVDY